MKRVLITGATGFIGRQCLDSLLAKEDHEVHVISRHPREKQYARARWHEADLLDREQMSRVLKEVSPTQLLHLAWYAEPGAYWTSLQNFRWVQASLDLFAAFAEHGGGRIVSAGTCAEYDWTGDGICSEASTPLDPATLYGACKHATRIMLEAFARQANLSTAWGRIFFLYGPHEHPQRLVPSVIRSLLKNETALCSHGRQVRDFLYVADVAEAFVKLLDSDVRGAVNIGSGRAANLQELINEIGNQLKRPELIQLNALPAPPNEPDVLVAGVDRLTNEVEWQPRFDLSEGIKQTIEWWRQNTDAAAVA